MARLRKFCSYRSLERPYTRRSKYRKKDFVKANPNVSIVRFEMGVKKDFPCTLMLKSKRALQIRHNAIEAGRQSSNKVLEEGLGKTGYFMHIQIYPYHILRENPLASGAGADRMSTGMQMSYGKPIGRAAQVKLDQTLVKVGVNKQHMDIARTALKRFASKLPCSCRIEIAERKAG